MTTEKLRALPVSALTDCLGVLPYGCKLVVNQVGNLAVLDADNYYIGYINFRPLPGQDPLVLLDND